MTPHASLRKNIQPRRILIAIDSFKGCLSSAEAGRAAAEGFHKRWPKAEVVCLPVSDGGEGWLEAYAFAFKRAMEKGLETTWEWMSVAVNDPLLRPVWAKYLKAGDLAVLEVAEACGLHLLKPEERHPLLASSRGVGDLLADAIRHGCKRFIVGLGGSGISDAGVGMIETLPFPFLVGRGQESSPSEMHTTPSLQGRVRGGSSFLIATDVDNPLCGPDGAAAVFGPQKGATPDMVLELDRRARAFAQENARRMGFDKSREPGAGAAGGLGYAFMQFFGAERRSGAELLLEQLCFDELVADADLIITGEGHADPQTLMGKLPAIVLRHAHRAGVPCHLLAGAVEDSEALLAAGFSTVHGINPPNMPLHEAMRPEVARHHLALTAYAATL